MGATPGWLLDAFLQFLNGIISRDGPVVGPAVTGHCGQGAAVGGPGMLRHRHAPAPGMDTAGLVVALQCQGGAEVTRLRVRRLAAVLLLDLFHHPRQVINALARFDYKAADFLRRVG